MSAPAWHDDPANARLLCAGDDLGELIRMQCCLDADLDFIIIASADEATAALTAEASFDVIIAPAGGGLRRPYPKYEM